MQEKLPGRTERVFGIDMQVVSADELLRMRTEEVKPVQACMRVSDAPTPAAISADHVRRRQTLPCESCDELCWFDPKAGPGRLFVRLLCIQCLVAEAQRKEAEQ